MTENLRKPPKVPCGSCPYRKDTPSGIWHPSEYAKLPQYDGDTWEQSPQLFMCQQHDGNICGGWLMTHDPRHLLALQIHRVDPSVYDYHPDVEVYGSGREAAKAGTRPVGKPSPEAESRMRGIQMALEQARQNPGMRSRITPKGITARILAQNKKKSGKDQGK